MTEMRLEFPQLDKLEETLKSLQQKVDDLAKWVRPDSFVTPASSNAPVQNTAPVAPPTAAAQTAAPVPPAVAAPAQASVPVATIPSAPIMPPVSAPIAEAPSYTLAQVGKAGADLIAAHPEKMQELVALLQQFSVPSVQALKPDQVGAFATALRRLGATL